MGMACFWRGAGALFLVSEGVDGLCVCVSVCLCVCVCVSAGTECAAQPHSKNIIVKLVMALTNVEV